MISSIVKQTSNQRPMKMDMKKTLTTTTTSIAFVSPVWQRCVNLQQARTNVNELRTTRRGLPSVLTGFPSTKRVSNSSILPKMLFADSSALTDESSSIPKEKFSAKGMSVEEFFERSIGEWRSQRSSHNLAWTQFEQITSEIIISKLDTTHSDIISLCERNEIKPIDTMFNFKMQWEGESDWDDDDSGTNEGETIMSVIKDSDTHGRLLRSSGYAETVPAVGHWEMTDDGVFVLNTLYDAAGAEERIWFATPDLRLRVSQIRTNSGTGVITASFSSEIRRLNLP